MLPGVGFMEHPGSFGTAAHSVAARRGSALGD